MIKRFNANQARLRRHYRIRGHLRGSAMRPRLNVFRSGQHIYAQVIDDRSGRTLVSASSIEQALRDFKPEPSSIGKNILSGALDQATKVIEMAAEVVLPKEQKAKVHNASSKASAKGGAATQAKFALPVAEKRAAKTPVEALVAISHNRKVATAREVGKILAQRAKEQGINCVVFDRGGYAYHGRVAALAEGAREVGLDF